MMIRPFATLVLAASLGAAFAAPAAAESTKLALGISGWTGFAPLILADKAGLFKKHGIEVDLKMIPQASRNLALASGSIECAATTVETHVAWNTNGVPITQIFQMDKSYGADGIVARNGIKSIADLKGKSVAVSAPGTSPYFLVAWMLNKNHMTMKDINVVTLEPDAAAEAFIAGSNDAASTYEPYLSSVRNKPKVGHILATTLDYPMIMDTVGCSPKWLKANPKTAKALTDSYFDALDMIAKDPDQAYTIMGAASKQTAKEFKESASLLRWASRDDNKKFFASEIVPFMKEAAAILKDAGVIRKLPDNYAALYDASYIQ